jgi:hypothetical protein
MAAIFIWMFYFPILVFEKIQFVINKFGWSNHVKYVNILVTEGICDPLDNYSSYALKKQIKL